MFERVLAAGLLLSVAPVLAAACAAITAVDGWAPLYRQERAGCGGKPFTVIKLRTLRKNALSPEQVGQVRAESPLILPGIGGFLRRSRLDEIPQLAQVMTGEMRFVGPRPALLSDVAEYSPWERRRLEVAPGLTGWAQVNGNTALSWADRIALDVYYIDHRSWRLNAKVLARTALTIIAGEGVHQRNLEKAKKHAARLTRCGSVD